MEEMIRHLNIKALAEDDRPREKLMNLGRQSLSDAELLAIVLGSGNRTESAVQLARRILSDNQNNVSRLSKLSLNELKLYSGVGIVKAVTIAAAFELGRRYNESETSKKVKITSSEVAYQLLRKRLSDLPHEESWLLLLDRANQVVKEVFLSKGGISGTVIDNRLVCRFAIENNASGVIIAHNHPSGQLVASEQDREVTRKLSDALRLFDIILVDHLIVGEKEYLSFLDTGMLPQMK